MMPPEEEIHSAKADSLTRLTQALRRLLMRRATVAKVDTLADRFQLVTLVGLELANVEWTAGQKIQIAVGSGFSTRTYTPVDWSRSSGQLRILGYAHGNGPGDAWLRNIRPGDQCDLFGPRNSLDLRRLTSSIALFGDETSVGLGCAIASRNGLSAVACHFEVADSNAVRTALTRLGLHEASLIQRAADDAHIVGMEAILPGLMADGRSFVLTGNANTIQRLRSSLRTQGVPAGRILTKAYWAPGKAGLD